MSEKLLLRKDGATEWTECGGTSDSIVLAECHQEFCPLEFAVKVVFKLRDIRRMTKQLKQLCGYLKRPKCTYKTIKRDCAKRNR